MLASESMSILFGETSAIRSHILSGSELSAREGVNLQKGMNFRDGTDTPGEQLSVFLVLERDGEFTDSWDVAAGRYAYEGHDSVAEGARGRIDNQLLAYASGKLTDNGKFYKTAHAYKDGLRKEPLQVQVYEKLDPGVWFDKGIFNLVDATYKEEAQEAVLRKVARFFLEPADAALPESERLGWSERILGAGVKSAVWQRERGRCRVCGEQSGLHFMAKAGTADLSGPEGVELRCPSHLD